MLAKTAVKWNARVDVINCIGLGTGAHACGYFGSKVKHTENKWGRHELNLILGKCFILTQYAHL